MARRISAALDPSVSRETPDEADATVSRETQIAGTDLPLSRIVYRDISTLIGYARNSRVHSDSQISALAAAMVEWGFTNPVLLDGSSGIIAGHGRCLAAERVWSAGKRIPNCPDGQVPCIELPHLSETQKRALVIADNQLGLTASWNYELLALEVGELSELGADLSLTGFSSAEVETLLGDPVEDPAAAWQGMPEFESEDKTSAHKIIVHFEQLADMDEFARLIGQQLSEKTKSIWYPEVVKADFASQRYVAADERKTISAPAGDEP